jgi:diaminopropionate ammonia-lyase
LPALAAMRGLACRIFLPARSLPGRRAAIADEGADVVVVGGGYEDAVGQAVAAGGEPGALLIADVGESGPADWVIDGYATLFAEASEQAAYDLVIVPVGVGSLGAAAARHGAERGLPVIGVEPAAAACLSASLAEGRPTTVANPGTVMAGLDCAEVSPAAWPSLLHGIAGAITVEDAAAQAAMAELDEAGLGIGECGAAPLAALRLLMTDPACSVLRQAIRVGPASAVLLIATEGRTGN